MKFGVPQSAGAATIQECGSTFETPGCTGGHAAVLQPPATTEACNPNAAVTRPASTAARGAGPRHAPRQRLLLGGTLRRLAFA